jgi:mannosyltransferase
LNKKTLNKIIIIILFVLTIVSFTLRFIRLDSESIWLDESLSIKQAQEEKYSDTLNLLKNDIHLPTYISILHFWIKLFGTSEFTTRFLSVIFGTLSTITIYFLAKCVFNEKIGIISSIILTFSPILICYSQEARLYSMFVFLSIISFHSYYKLIKNINKQPSKKYKKTYYINLLTYFICNSFLIYTHLFAFIIIIIQNLYVLYLYKTNIKKIAKWIISQILLFIVFIPWLPSLLNQLRKNNNTMWIDIPNIWTLRESFYEFIGSKYLTFFVIILVFLIYIVSKIRLKEKSILKNFKIGKIRTDEKKNLFLIVLWLIIPFLIVISTSYFFKPIYHIRYLLFTIPAFFIALAFLIDKLFIKNKKTAYIIILIIIVLSSLQIYYQLLNIEKDNWKEVSIYLKDNVKKNEYIFVSPFYQQTPLTYYYDEKCFKEYYIHPCSFTHSNLISLQWNTTCCNDSSRIISMNKFDELKYYTTKSIWLVSLKEKLYESQLSIYFLDKMNQTFYRKIGDIKIYKFEKK